MNIAELQRDNHYVTKSNRQKAKIHPSSVLSGKPAAKFVLFTELVVTGKTYMRTVTQLEPDWIEEYAANLSQSKKLFSIANGS